MFIININFKLFQEKLYINDNEYSIIFKIIYFTMRYESSLTATYK